MSLRDFQQQAVNQVQSAWHSGAQNVMLCLPTGGGKTVAFCHIVQQSQRPARIIAHRQELVSQISLTLNREGVPHGIVAPKAVVQATIRAHIETQGKSYYQAKSIVKVVSVDTANARGEEKGDANVEIVVMDEGHHVLRENKWGKAMSRHQRARGLFVTAHAVRADGLGLGRSGAGMVDALVIGPYGRQLIARGYLTDYRIFCPDADIDRTKIELSSATGDYNQVKLRDEVHSSKGLVGSVVGHYLSLAAGKLGITFAVDIEEATKLQRAYMAAGVASQVITANTDIRLRSAIMRKFRAREIMQLVSVDVLGEGVDVPAVEVVSFARPTASWQLMCQQLGRALRVMVAPEHSLRWGDYSDQKRREIIAASDKPRAIVIDHVGNIAYHWMFRKLPCSEQVYDLNNATRGSRKPADDAIPLTRCLNPTCLHPYESVLSKCPLCGTPRPAPRSRGNIEAVEGVLTELDPAVLSETYNEIQRIDGPPNAHGYDAVAHSIRRQHAARQDMQRPLRDMIALWAGHQRHIGRDDEETYRRFWYRYGVDVATAMTLNPQDACRLQARLIDDLNNVRAAT